MPFRMCCCQPPCNSPTCYEIWMLPHLLPAMAFAGPALCSLHHHGESEFIDAQASLAVQDVPDGMVHRAGSVPFELSVSPKMSSASLSLTFQTAYSPDLPLG